MLIRSGAYERFRARNAARVVSYRPVSPSVAWRRLSASARTWRRILPLGSRALVGPMGTDSTQSRLPSRLVENSQVPRLVSGANRARAWPAASLMMSILVLSPLPATSYFMDPEMS